VEDFDVKSFMKKEEERKHLFSSSSFPSSMLFRRKDTMDV
jgi:hypothetical protein